MADNKYLPAKRGVSEISREIGKLPPQSVEVEEAVLGAIMLERDSFTQVADLITPDTFYKDPHRLIYQAMTELFHNGDPIDIKTVVHRVRKNGHLDMVGGAFYISELTTKVNSGANIVHHAFILVEQYKKRQYIQVSGAIQHMAYDDTEDIFDIETFANHNLSEISGIGVRNEPKAISQLSHVVVTETEQRKIDKETQGSTGVPSGFTKLDVVTGGWQKSNLIIIAARPGQGKTSFILSNARNTSLRHNIPLAIFSLEMNNRELIDRLACMEGEIGYERIKKTTYSDNEWKKYTSAIGRLEKAPIYIDDTPGLSILELRTKCRRLHAQRGVKLIIIDYLQLMKGDIKKGWSGNREQEISSITRGMKELAKELDVPVIALSQLSRKVEETKEKRPQLSHLRESGSIEQDADIVAFLFRPRYYKLKHVITDESGNVLTKDQDASLVDIAKNRHGEVTEVWLKFVGWKMEWTDLPYEKDKLPSQLQDDFKVDNGGIPSVFASTGNIKDEQEDSNDDMPF